MSQNGPLFVIAGGGTGGHLYPGFAVIDALRAARPDAGFAVFGTLRVIDSKLTSRRGLSLIQQTVRPMTKNPLQIPGFLLHWVKSVAAARRAFKDQRPALVLGLGGYAAGPPVVAAARLHIPTAIFNPDAVPGLANQRLSRTVDRIFTQWHETAEYFDRSPKVLCTGCPIRPAFASVDRATSIRKLKLDPARKTLLVTGASQGASTINDAVLELADLWRSHEDWQIVHITGKADSERCRAVYERERINARVLAYTEHMPECMASADLVLSRAGASTLAEITAMGIPSVLMPYPFDRKQHQMANARILADAHAALVVEDAADVRKNAKLLRRELGGLMQADHRRVEMREIAQAMGHFDAADRIAETIIDMTDEG